MNGKRDLRRLDLNLLVIFEAILKAGSISRAANNLGMSQPTVSNALARLRLQYNDRLFIRSDGGVRPTPLALSLAGPVTQALNALRNGMMIGADFDIATANRHFRLELHDFSIPSILPPLLGLLNQPESSCRLEVVTPDWGAPYQRLINGEVDILLDVFPQEIPGLVFEPLAEVTPVCIVREGHPTIGPAISLEQFNASGHVVLDQPYQARYQMGNMLMAAGATRREVCIVPNAADLAATVAVTDLVATVPERYAQIIAPINRLRVMPTPFAIPDIKLFLCWPEENAEEPGLRWLRDTIRNVFSA
ncbi:LysR family transcriptional regulator [Acidimangrovimonas sediminis]|uniref:LysR family transcriptional regulator n=1 Tax=Acidimangrovimonas sediminis TaxID=2056283 RepID=UPI000C8035ED|nr:LysR family transcriptional regulator [Acidimangrovimonas sediminis]